jgi:hypothetical protein
MQSVLHNCCSIEKVLIRKSGKRIKCVARVIKLFSQILRLQNLPKHKRFSNPPKSILFLVIIARLRMFENRVLRRIFGPKRDEVTGEWRKLHNEELNNLYSSSNIVRVIKSRRMGRSGHVTRMGEGRGVYRVLVANMRVRDHWGDPGVDGRIILGWIFRKWDVGVWTGWS